MSRLWAVGVAIVVLLLCEAFAPTEAASGSSCEVRNVTRGTTGHALKAMVRAAHEGDHLWVRGRCVGDVVIGKDLTITGKGQAVVSGLDRYRVLLIRKGARVVLRNLTITQGDGGWDGKRGGGGGIYNEGVVTLKDSVVKQARAGEDPGGAITNTGTMRIIDSVVSDSRADWGGGIGNLGTLTISGSRVLHNHPQGIWSRGPMTIKDSVVRGNAWGGLFVGGTADVTISGTRIRDNPRGGGIEKNGQGRLTLKSCLITGNTSAQDGGGIRTRRGQLDLIGTTITGNRAARHGGGLFVLEGTTEVTLDATSSVTGNTPDDCFGTTAC